MSRAYILFASIILCAAGTASAQTEPKLKSYFEGRHAALKRARVVSVGPPTTYLKEGLNVEEVLRLLGRPADVSERQEGGRRVVAYAFPRGKGRVLLAEFVNGVLVRSRVEALSSFAQASADR